MVGLLKQASGLIKYPVSFDKYSLREQDSGLFLEISTGKLRWCDDAGDGTKFPREDAKELAQYFMWRAHERGIEAIVHYDLTCSREDTPDYLPEHIDEDTDDCEDFGEGI